MSDHPRDVSGPISHRVMEALPMGVVLLNAHGDVVWANSAWDALCSSNRGAAQTPPQTSYAVMLANTLHVDDAGVERILSGVDAVRRGRQDRYSDDCAIASEGRWLSITATSCVDGEQRLVLVTHQEITDRKRREKSLELYRTALEHAADVVIIADSDGIIQYVNPTFTAVHGLSADDAMGRPIWDAPGVERDQPLSDAIMPALRAGKPWREERPVESDHRELTWEERSVAPIRADDGSLEHLIVIGRDVTEQRTYLDELKRHAYYDSLTGLPNRALFIDRLAHAHLRVQRSDQSLAVMYLDLNGFKRVNDSFGHGVGDQVLAEVARRLTKTLRASDTVARTGGDEFVFLLEELATEEDALTVAHRLIGDISRPLHLADTFISVSGSIGIAFNTPAIGEPTTLVDLADIALYHAKTKSDDRVTVYHDNMEMPNNQRHDPFRFPS